MKKYVVFLRAVNVGGTGKLPMAELRTLCEELGFVDVRTYIASGNVVLSSSKTKAQTKAALEKRLQAYAGKPIGVLVRTASELQSVLANNPYAGKKPNFTVAFFLDKKPHKNLLTEISGQKDEELCLGAREIYVHYPQGMGVSKLKIAAAKHGTARNMNTINKMAQWVSEVE